ncbi:hypothetical protein D3C79_817400 [compost metagenome]
MLKRTQAVVLDADGLALDLTGTVATLVDQYPQHLATADLFKVTGLAHRHVLLRPRQARVGGTDDHQAKRQQQGEQVSQHAKTYPRSVGSIHVCEQLVINDGKRPSQKPEVLGFFPEIALFAMLAVPRHEVAPCN